MCGITGYIDQHHRTDPHILDEMVSTLHHRGPNDRGTHMEPVNSAFVALGHTRLSILDLREHGKQPMRYKQYVLVYNGEIYNFREIRQTLRQYGHRFKTETDTEVLLHAFAEWGVHCVDRFIGMFAFVVYDQHERKLYAFRDRPGVKPFFFSHDEAGLIFGSELKSLHAHPRFKPSLNVPAIGAYFDMGYVPGHHCVYDSAQKLRAGHYFVYDIDQGSLHIKRYWDARHAYQVPKTEVSYEAATDQLENLLKSAFEYRMVSDVPVGIFLSGGYDSTAVAAILQANSAQQLKTFTIGFEHGNNEAPYAQATALQIGTDHHEYICTTREAQEIIPSLPYYYDEPFADSSAIPTVLVSRFAKSHVTVALSADGGDESFAGYSDYDKWRRYESWLKRVPKPLRGSASRLAHLTSIGIPHRSLHRGHHLQTIAASLHAHPRDMGPTLYEWMRRLPKRYRRRIFRSGLVEDIPHAFNHRYELTDRGEHPMLADYLGYLPDDILVKVDRATMSTALEGREPLLDHRILEFAASLPLQYKIGDGTSKRILKDIVHRYVPKSMMDRPKRGFSIPLNNWLRGDLNELVMDTLQPDSVRAGGILNGDFVAKRLSEFNAGQLHYDALIWKLFMFQLWHKTWH